MNNWSTLKKSWGDRVQGSWWKVCLIFLAVYMSMMLLSSLVVGPQLANYPAVTPDNIEQIMAEILSEEPLYMHLQNSVYIAVIIGVGAFFKMKLLKWEPLKWSEIKFTLLAYATSLIVTIVFAQVVSQLHPEYITTENQEQLQQMFNGHSPYLLFINLVILTPIFEELVFRGLIMKYLLPLTPVLGAIVSWVLFTWAHIHAGSSWIDYVLYGILSAGMVLVYWRTRRLEYTILFHMIQNAIGFLQFI